MTIGSSGSRSRISCMTLLRRAHAAGIPSLRQQPFDEVEALLRLGQLESQPAHFAFQRFKPLLEVAPVGELLPTGGRPAPTLPTGSPTHALSVEIRHAFPRTSLGVRAKRELGTAALTPCPVLG